MVGLAFSGGKFLSPPFDYPTELKSQNHNFNSQKICYLWILISSLFFFKDVYKWLTGKHEIEIIDQYIRIKQKLVSNFRSFNVH